jgi:uncharacterized protein with HEPN domain
VNLRFQKYCADILNSIDAISIHLSIAPDLEAYQSNLTVRRAVERELEIIGEAMNRLLEEFPDTAITDSHRIVGLRNRIIHGYASVDHKLIWSIVQTHLPKLREEITQIMRQP